MRIGDKKISEKKIVDMKALAFALIIAAALTASAEFCVAVWTDVSQRSPGRLSATPIQERPVEIIVRLRPESARAFADASTPHDTPALVELKAVLMRFGVELKPQHPGIADTELASYFTISNLSTQQADELAAALKALDAVDAAYVQPSPAPPRPQGS